MFVKRLLISVGVLAALSLTMTAQAAPVAAKASQPSASAMGYDVGYPQCGSRLPRGGSFGIVEVTDGLPWSVSPCLSAQYRWASGKPQAPAFYMNTANPEQAGSNWAGRATTGPRTCANLGSTGDGGCAYNYGWNSAANAFASAAAAVSASVASSHAWWLDVETGNSWNGTSAANGQDVQGSVDYLRTHISNAVGIYSTGYQWAVITSGYSVPSAPDWVAGASNLNSAPQYCGPAYSFSSGPVKLVQFPSGGFDGDYAC